MLSSFERIMLTVKPGQRTRVACPHCQDGKTVLITGKPEGVSAFCFKGSCPEKSRWVPRPDMARDWRFDTKTTEEELTRLAQATSSKLPQGFVRGIPDELAFYVLQYGFAPTDPLLSEVGTAPSMPGRLIFPVHHPSSGIMQYWAARLVRPRPMVPKWVGSPFGRDSVIDYHRSFDRPEIVITEDLLSGLKAHKAGFTSIALMGTHLSPRQLMRLIHRLADVTGPVVIWMDDDRAGRVAAAALVRKLELVLRNELVVMDRAPEPKTLNAVDIQLAVEHVIK